MTLRKFVLLSTLTVALLAYYLYQPLPENFEDANAYRVATAAIKIVDSVEFLVNFFDPLTAINIGRKAASFLTRKDHADYRDAKDNIAVSDAVFDGITVRLYQPTDSSLNAAIIYSHGGLWLLYNIDDYDEVLYTLAKKTRATVVAIEYPLSPEEKHPASLTAVYRVAKYLSVNYEKYKIDNTRICIAGDSTGANMAAAVVHKLRKQNIEVKLQVLIQPVLQFFDLTLPSYQQNIPYNHLNVLSYTGLSRIIFEHFGVYVSPRLLAVNNHTTAEMKSSIITEKYLSWKLLPKKYTTKYKKLNEKYGESKETVAKWNILFDPDVSPLLADDNTLKLAPTTYVVTSEHDIFRDDGYIYTERLRSLGVKSIIRNYDNGYHSALNVYHNKKFKFPQDLLNNLAAYVKQNL